MDRNTNQPWLAEKPIRAQWSAHGFPCLALRLEEMGHWVGYVGVPEGHPAHGREDIDLSVHGGVTFSGFGDERYDFKPTNPAEKLWFIGFDCAHYCDTVPMIAELLPGTQRRSTYKNLAYVRAELNQLAEQLAALAPSHLPPVDEIEWDDPKVNSLPTKPHE